MKKLIAVIFLTCLGFTSLFANSAITFFVQKFIGTVEIYDSNIQTINEGLTDFSKQLGFSVSQAATQQNVWADAQIGKFLPSYPVHFGFGLNSGITHMDTTGIAKAAEVLSIKNIKNNYYFPVLNADFRIGGIYFPFDVGFSFMKIDEFNADFFGCNFMLDLYTIGFDVRYALVQEDTFIPKISVGGGYFYNHGEFEASSSSAAANIEYNVKTAYGQLQVSKRLSVLTPFAGVRGTVSSYKNKWSWKLSNSYSEQISITALLLNCSAKTSDSNTVSSNGMKIDNIQPQFFCGCGFTYMCLQGTLSLTADLRNIADDGLWSGAFSFRVKI